MGLNITLGQRFENFIREQVESGRVHTIAEVRDFLRARSETGRPVAK